MTEHAHKPIVTLSDVSFAYSAKEALTHVDLNINEGDYLGVIGPNGAGKTTLLKVILGLLEPSTGTVTLFGKDRRVFRDHALIGYVPQKTAAFDMNFPATVYEVVLMGRYAKRGLLHRITPHDHRSVRLALERVAMWEHRDRLIGDLSGGQQQRVFIARALATDPKILFLDEPTAGIDHASQENFYALLRDLNKRDGLTIVLITHDIGVIAEEVSRLAYVDTTLRYYPSPAQFLAENSRDMLLHQHDH